MKQMSQIPEKTCFKIKIGKYLQGEYTVSVSTATVLVVDDDASHRRLMQHWLQRGGFQTQTFATGQECLSALNQSLPDAILLDLHMKGLDGHETLQRIHEVHPELPVIMLTGDVDPQNVVRAMQAGACNYLAKPVDRTRLLQALSTSIASFHQKFQQKYEQRTQSNTDGYGALLGRSEIMRRLFRNLERVAPSNITVLIAGESGTGKELVARAIHDNSRRGTGPFIALNCAAIPETLQESELFGHEKGSFTGANSRRIGSFEQAHGGTLFLDEVGELSPALQAKLLRVIQERRFYRVGGSEEIDVDVRLLAATHRDLSTFVKSGAFREDLYYRLAVFEVDVPALRERTEDIHILTKKFIDQYSVAHQRSPIEVTSKALKALENYRWPGNVRELQNALERAVVVSEGSTIELDNLPSRVVNAPLSRHRQTKSSTDPSIMTMNEVEQQTIQQALIEFDGNVSQVIRELGIPRTTFYRKLKKYGLSKDILETTDK